MFDDFLKKQKIKKFKVVEIRYSAQSAFTVNSLVIFMNYCEKRFINAQNAIRGAKNLKSNQSKLQHSVNNKNCFFITWKLFKSIKSEKALKQTKNIINAHNAV